MKKLITLFVAVFSMPILFAQDITDALRYSQSEIQGTARFRALSGAFGALGGDMSAVSINPAGSAVFSQSHASFSVSNMEITNDTRYFNGSETLNQSYFDLNQGGASFVFKNNNRNSPWKKFTIGIAYDKTNDFDDEWFSVGTNNRGNNNFDNTIASYFFDYAQGLERSIFKPSDQELIQYFDIRNSEAINDPQQYFDDRPLLHQDLSYEFLRDLEGFGAQQAFLGYQSFILDPEVDSDDNSNYLLNVGEGNFTHDYSYTSTGYNGKVAFNIAAQYEDNLYIGLNLNSHFVDYERSTTLIETNSNGGLINEIDFRNTLRTTGNGFSFQLGGILKLTNEFRLGLTYDSPTWYTIEEETTQYLDTNELLNLGFEPVAPEVTNIYPKYKLQTPSKLTGSLAYIFGKQGLLSFDYSRKDYSSIKFKPNGDFLSENEQIKNDLTSAATYRFGGEYKYGQFSFRGGYRFEESPYKDGLVVGDLDGYSLGLGYNFGNTKLDITFDQSNRSYQTSLYNVGLTAPVTLDQTNSNVTISLSFNI